MFLNRGIYPFGRLFQYTCFLQELNKEKHLGLFEFAPQMTSPLIDNMFYSEEVTMKVDYSKFILVEFKLGRRFYFPIE